MLQQDDKKRDMTDCRPKIPSVSLSKVRFITCRNIRYPDKSAKDNSANDTSAKPTVRMPTVRKGQQCECQQCECDSGANVSSANATAVRKTILRTVQTFFFFLQKLLLLFTSIFYLKMPIAARFSIYQEM